MTGGAPLLTLFEKWPAGEPAAWDSALSSPLNGAHCHCARVLASLLFYAMRRNLKRYYGAGDLHFITCSCYRRQPLLGTARRRRNPSQASFFDHAPQHIWQKRFYDFNVWTERKRIF